MDLSALRSLSGRWRDEADRFERDAVPGHAAVLRRVAGELDDVLRAWWTEPLRLQEAAEEAGLEYRAIQKRVERGRVPNVGKKGAPRVRRCDLYEGGPRLETGEPDLAEEVLVSRRTGS